MTRRFRIFKIFNTKKESSNLYKKSLLILIIETKKVLVRQ